jgi:hypothetical protein
MMKKPDTSATKKAFARWAETKGYNVVKGLSKATTSNTIGDCALRTRSGKYTIEVARALDAAQVNVIAAGFTHGWEYPVVNATEAKLLEFLETDTNA